MVETNRKKRADYAASDNIFRNFERVAGMMDMAGYDAQEDILNMVFRKASRITNLRGKEPMNESVEDSWLDLAVYAILGYVYYRRSDLGGV